MEPVVVLAQQIVKTDYVGKMIVRKIGDTAAITVSHQIITGAVMDF